MGDEGGGAGEQRELAGVAVGLRLPTDRPADSFALVGGRVVTMRDSGQSQEVIEDGVVLARCFAAHTTAHADVPIALQAYEAARRERTSKLVRAANDNAARFHNPALGDASGAARYVDSEWQEAKVKQRYDWVFEYDPVHAAV